jgi:large subunit ribosomal protein L18
MARHQYLQIAKRRREGKTDYRKRRGIILGKKPFLTIHVSNRYVYGQVMKPAANGDVTLCSSNSRTLPKESGWKGSTKNLPSAYLTGLLLGKKAKEKGVAEAIAYAGVSRFVHGSRLSAFLAGAKDGGLQIEFNEEIIPAKDRLSGKHIADYAKQLQTEHASEYKQLFSRLIENGLKPEDYPTHFQQVQNTLGSSKAK